MSRIGKLRTSPSTNALSLCQERYHTCNPDTVRYLPCRSATSNTTSNSAPTTPARSPLPITPTPSAIFLADLLRRRSRQQRVYNASALPILLPLESAGALRQLRTPNGTVLLYTIDKLIAPLCLLSADQLIARALCPTYYHHPTLAPYCYPNRLLLLLPAAKPTPYCLPIAP